MSDKVIIDGIIGFDTDIHIVRQQLEAADGKDVVAEIASPGGLVSEGLKIYNALKNYSGRVDTHLTGSVASMGTYIAMVGEKRTAENNAMFMIHNGHAVAVGDHRVMYRAGKNLDSLSNMIAKEYAAKSDTPLDVIRAAMDEETYYYGDEIKEAGFVHEMVGEKEPENKAEAVAMTALMVEECQEKINTPASIKKDMTALATMLEQAPRGAEHKTQKKENQMEFTLENLKSEAPELLAQIQAEAKTAGYDEGLQAGVDQERKRVTELMAVEDADQEAQAKAITEGTAVDAAYKLFFEAEKAKKTEELENLHKETPESAGQSGKETDQDGKETFMDAVTAYQDEKKCTRTEALKAVAVAKPALHAAFLEGK